ncbi:hemerythrin domain-containing protein [Billgrantia pellis]|uniref:Hemerythrin domain-containing protein n=1 Tax=Billgrantia pellis TaxID=2606936 RepID=A0A7V7G1W7_9GAMM|nr:hemerythrin domain-containing protein [Halomonas pellis]KAA0013859.1 hemerythrin domain-containing protein [Halomonas pellis]
MSEHPRNGTVADVVDILTIDHRQMEELLGRIQHTPEPDQRRELADTLIAEVMRHAVAEEMHVYPVIEKYVPNGTDDVQHDKQEHDEIVQVMKQLEDADTSDPTFMDHVRKLDGLLRHHASDEEGEQFPKLRSHIPGEQLVDMGRKVETAKQLAPTRPHPSAPHSELFHKTVGPGVGMIDRLRDKLSGRMTG